MSFFFSYIIPCYNSEKHIIKCLENLKKNNHQNEIILVDDNSTDNTIKTVLNFKKTNKIKNIKIIKNSKNLGPGSSRNKAIRAASGQYVIFLDSDDSVNNNEIYKIKKKIIKNKYPDLVLGLYSKDNFPFSNKFIFKGIAGEKMFSNYQLIKLFNKHNVVFEEAWPFIVKKKFLEKKKITFPQIKINEDQVFTNLMLFNTKIILFVKNNFYYHRNFKDSLSRKFDLERCLSYFESTLLLSVLLKKSGKSIFKKYLKNLYKILVDNFNNSLMVSDNNRSKIIFNMFKKKVNFFYSTLLKTNLINNNFKDLIFSFNIKNIKRYENNYTKKITDFVKNNNKKNYPIYLYCKTDLSYSYYKVLKKNNFKTKIIDDAFVKNEANVKKIKNTLIIICHHSIKVREKIKKVLLSKKIKNIIFNKI
tara:strand:- start:3687 stop:4940 length:1254 start_codon:yes stop_codon:yes gene_type:complete